MDGLLADILSWGVVEVVLFDELLLDVLLLIEPLVDAADDAFEP